MKSSTTIGYKVNTFKRLRISGCSLARKVLTLGNPAKTIGAQDEVLSVQAIISAIQHSLKEHQDIALKIVEHDLKSIIKADIIVTVLNGGSYGAALEMHTARQYNKPVIVLAENGIRTPFIIYLADYIVSTKIELINLLKSALAFRLMNESGYLFTISINKMIEPGYTDQYPFHNLPVLLSTASSI